MINTNEFLTIEESNLLKQMEEIKDKIDAIEIIKALTLRVDKILSKNFICQTSSKFNSDRAFRYLCSLIPADYCQYYTKGLIDENTEDHLESISILIEDNIILVLDLNRKYYFNQDRYDYTLITRVITLDNVKSEYGITDLNQIINSIKDKFNINKSQNRSDSDGTLRERK